MGFSYNHLGLCCDFCSNAGPKGNVRKISYPYGYCQAWACCETCKKKGKHKFSSTGFPDSPARENHELCKTMMQILELEAQA